MLITIHNSKLEKVAFIDNDKQDTLNFYNDKFSQYLTTASATFEFTVYKKGIKSDTIKEKAYQTLTERSFVSFKSNGKTYLFNVMSTEENDTEIHCYCENLNLELLNEYAGPYKSNNQLSFVEYCNLFGILKNGAITIGVNEVADFRRTIEWTGQDTNLKRLLSIANNFDAEIEFETKLNNDSTLKSFIMNIYRKNDGKNQGVGKRRDDIVLEYGKNIKNVKRKIDKNIIFNAVKPTGHATATTTTTTVKQGANKLGTVSWSGGNLNYAGHNISSDVVGQILTLCTQHKLLPSGVFSQLYLESWWGASNVARVDNNWGGLTWTGNGNRPSGVVVTQGSARPANEGGYYMHFASVSDYFKDYTYLLAEQGIYKVKGASTIDAYTKGLFKVGGATYDYATAGYAHYASLMRDIRSGINRNNNNAMDNLDNQYRSIGTVGTAPVSQIASKTKSVLDALTAKKGQLIGSGQCYALSAWYAMSLGGPGLGGGVTSLRGLIGAGMAASQIGTDYNWAQFGWKVVVPNKVADLIPGSIANIKANFNGGFLNTTGWGHTVVIKAISGDTLTVLEQNFAGHQYVEERTYSASAYLGAIQTLCYPPEIVQGKRIDGTTQVPPEQQNTETSTSTQEKTLEIRPDLYREYKNDAGQVEFYVKNGAVYAPLSKDLYPSAFSGIETDDNWIRKDFDIQTDSEEVLIQEAIKLLKKNAYPEITYEIDGYSTDLAIGDTVKVYDKSFSPKLILEARVTEQHTSFTNPSQNKSVFDNFKALESKISSMLTDRMNEMVEETKPYDLRLITDNGTSFKNGEGISVLTAEVWKSNKKYDATYQFKSGDKLLSAGLELMVKAIDLTPNEPLIVTVDAYIGNDYVASKQVTFINVNDGLNGSNGRGITSTEDYYLVSASKTGITSATTGWVKGTPQVATATNKYHWHYHVDIYSDGTRKETVPAVIGIYGDQGLKGADGANGKDGQNGQIPHIAYADKSTNIFLDSFTNFKSYGGYQGSVVTSTLNNGAWDVTASGGTHPTKHIFGFNGTTGKTLWYYIKIKNTHATNPLRIVFNGIDKTGASSFPTVTVNPGQTYVKFEQGICRTSYDFIQINIDAVTADKDIAYTIYDLALYNEQPFINLDFVNGSNKAYMGLYIDEIIQSSTDASKYAWTLIKGQDGAQGIQGPAGADGKTPYWHTAYANSSDGKTDFSLTDSTNKRFIGQYTDYTQADSTDPAKYKWVNMVGSISLSTGNLLASKYLINNYSSKSFTLKAWANTFVEAINIPDIFKEGETYTISFDAEIIEKSTVSTVYAKQVGFALWTKSNNSIFELFLKNLSNLNQKGRFELTFKCPKIEADTQLIVYTNRYFDGTKADNDTVKFDNLNVTLGNVVNKSWLQPIEDVDAKIDSKADQALTQEQLNALSEQSAIAKAELQAKASIDTLNQWITSYQNYVTSNNADSQQAKADLIAWSQKVEALGTQMGEVKETKIFMDTYFSQSSEGLVIGQTDGTSNILIKEDRISMFSAGNEVMYISQGVLNINNGIFALSIQLGRFREEQYAGNKDINVIRYVGGV